ncbi:putative solute-binding protein [Marinobacter sp. 1Y8]
MTKGIQCLLLISMAVWAIQGHAQQSRVFCVFDVAGANGYVYNTLKTYRRQMLQVGENLQMKPYTDEDKARADFDAGRCDLVAVTDMGVRHYNSFTGSISAIGAVPRYEDLRVLLQILSSPRVGDKMGDNGYQVIGVAPMGAAYLFVNDRSIDTVEDLKGKRITVFEGHYDAWHMVEYVGAIPVPAKISNFAELFNSGQADISYVPAAAYEVLEMSRGMGATGGIVKFPVGQVTIQLVAREGAFEAAFVQKSRKAMSRLYNESIRLVRQYEDAVPQSRWVNVPQRAKLEYQEMLREVRIDLDSNNTEIGRLAAQVYDDDMMRILRKVRCYTNPGGQECSSPDRE